MRKEQKSVKRTISACQNCGENGTCDCQRMLTRTVFDSGTFIQPFINLSGQFLDIRSWIALAATNKKLRATYHELAQPIVLRPSHFALSNDFAPAYHSELAFHQNPIVEFVTRDLILKLSHGKLSAQSCSEKEFQLKTPASFASYTFKNFLKSHEVLTVINDILGFSSAIPDNQNSNLKHIYFWTKNIIALYEINIQNAHLKEIYQIKTTADIQKVIQASDGKALVITDEAINNVYILDKSVTPTPTLTQQTFNMRCKDVMVLNSVNDLLILSDQGTIFALGNVRYNYHSPHLSVANYATLTPVFTGITDKIIGFDKGEDYLVVWTEKQITVIGVGHRNTVGKVVAIDDYSEIFMPHIDGKIVQVKAGDHHLLALTDHGEVYSGGHNYANQLARNTGFFTRDFCRLHRMERVPNLPNTIVAIYTGFDGQSAFIDYEGKTFLRGSTKFAPRTAPDPYQGQMPGFA
ncbi:MAG: RCC1 domain-containing protein [Coxiellaceae bacterium]|nr:RCC1 domain-containing protein [Coxiellaceae bacterium]